MIKYLKKNQIRSENSEYTNFFNIVYYIIFQNYRQSFAKSKANLEYIYHFLKIKVNLFNTAYMA